VVLHNLVTAPYLRGRGLASLLWVHLLGTLLRPELYELTVEVEFTPPSDTAGVAAPLLRELLADRTWSCHGEALAGLAERVEAERAALVRPLLRNLITAPQFRKRLERPGCAVAAISGDHAVFETLGKAKWPPYVAVQSIHTQFRPNVAQDLLPFDLALLDTQVLAAQPGLLEEIHRTNPELPVVLVGDAPAELAHPSLLARVPGGDLPAALAAYLGPFRPEWHQVRGEVLQANLLGLPERKTLVYYRNRLRSRRLFIVASGPSLADVDAARLDGELVMTINDALLKFPRAQYAAIMDARKLHELHLELLDVQGLFTLAGNSYGTEVKLLGTEGFSEDLEQGVYSGYTTAYFALQIAVYMGVREIYYLGLDLGNTEKQSHFFGSRSLQDRDRPEVYAKMRQSFEGVAERLKEMGVAVYNCSRVSTLSCFPHRALDDVLAEREPA